jgi:hypothetical protein
MLKGEKEILVAKIDLGIDKTLKSKLKTLSQYQRTDPLIQMVIDKLKMTNSYGYDEIPVKILKSCKHFISSPLTCIINRSLATGIFPDGSNSLRSNLYIKMVIKTLLVTIDPYHY